VQQVRLVIREQQAHKAQQEPGWFQELFSRCRPLHLRRPDLLYWEQPQ